jgi:hypothetical protein
MFEPPPRPSREQKGVPPAMDEVIATGMAKNPDQRYATAVELARAAHHATTVPFARPDQLTAAPSYLEDTQWAATRAAPGPQPPPAPPPPWVQPWVQPSPKRPMWRSPRVVIPAVLAVVVLIGGGVFAAVKVSEHHNPPASAPPASAPPATAAPNTGPFTGTYRADYGPTTDLDGKPVEGAKPITVTWGVRSACLTAGCVATASRIGGNATRASTLVFDDVGGRWVAVFLYSDQCRNIPSEYWEVLTVQPRPDGTLSGESSATSNNACESKRTVTFTRTGDADINSLPDPASQPPRVASPAEALHGRYQQTTTYTNNNKNPAQSNYAVRTDCLRTGDRCMSYFHSPNTKLPLVFESVKWIEDLVGDAPCSTGGTSHIKVTAEYPLPQPPQDPITLLTGHGHLEGTGSKCVGGDFDEKYVRTGD